MTPIIRPAVTADATAVAALITALQAHEVALQPTRKASVAEATPRIAASAWAEQEAGRGVILVAEVDGRILGVACAEMRTSADLSLPAGRRMVYLSDLAVAPNARSQGLGTLLLEATAAWGAARGAVVLRLSAITENEGAIRLYRRIGLAPVEISFERAL
jgi:GNAT superfamily N-acetyltransferase